MKNVNVYVDDSVLRYFLDKRCEMGAMYIIIACNNFQYLLRNLGLSANIKSYYSKDLRIPIINVDIQEHFDNSGEKLFAKQTIETQSLSFFMNMDSNDEFECLRNLGINIPIIYSFFNIVVY